MSLPHCLKLQLGQGACARVFQAVHIPTLTVVAVKCFPVEDQKKRKMVG
jgi:hypothetical protein